MRPFTFSREVCDRSGFCNVKIRNEKMIVKMPLTTRLPGIKYLSDLANCNDTVLNRIEKYAKKTFINSDKMA